mgnify:CR=1 FL=1
MNTILVATDFSKTAASAEDYASEIALHLGSKLELIHVYQIPVLTGETAAAMPALDSIEKDSITRLEETASRIRSSYGNELDITVAFRSGYSVSETLKQYIEEKRTDLLVMGIEEAGFLKEKLIGSPTTDIIKMSPCHVLVVHEGTRFKRPEKILLACDRLEDIKTDSLQLLKELAEVFMADITFLGIINEHHEKFSETASQKIRDMMREIDVAFYEVRASGVSEEIEKISRRIEADLVIVIKQRHSLIERLFHTSTTKSLVYHSNIPLLALHG